MKATTTAGSGRRTNGPTVAGFESLAERRIREAHQAGLFDEVEGTGAPIAGLSRPYDPAWWAKRWIRRQRAGERARELGGRMPTERAAMRRLPDETSVRRRIEEVNAEILSLNEEADPDDRLLPLEPATILAEWRAARPGANSPEGHERKNLRLGEGERRSRRRGPSGPAKSQQPEGP